jgi:hypothetical protein
VLVTPTSQNMKSNRPLLSATAVVLFLIGLSTRADIINNFTTPFDYVANGIIGDTNWDGVYLRFGDITGGSPGTDGNGDTIAANTFLFGGGYLGIQNARGNWSGADDDGFFIYKVVQGDFDVSVENVPATFNGGTGFDNRGNNFTGLQIRLYNTNNSGAPFSTTSTNNSENSLRLWRFDEFSIDGTVRQSTNGGNNEAAFPQPTTNTWFNTGATNETRFYRITRSGDLFQFYIKTNAGDGWFLITNANTAGFYVPTNGSVSRPDWAGQMLQVGICAAAFNSGTATRDSIFTGFQLIATNISFPVMPATPSSVVTTATNIGGSLTLSWTLGNPGDSSLVVMSRNHIQHNPIQGVTYTASSAFGDLNGRLGGGNEFAVYNGTGTSVTVTNLGADNLTYDVAVYEYASGPSPVYNTASPAINRFVGPGVINGVSLSVPTNEIPVNGAVKIQLLATFSTGESNVDQSINASWSSGDPTIVGVNAVGAVSGVAPGTATITATFGAFTPSTNITVHSPTLTDTFTAVHDYLGNGLLGTTYDGLYLNFGDVPGAVATGDGPGSTVALDSQITSTNGLYMSSVQSTWQGTGNDGPLLYKLVPGSINGVSGDFQALVHINTMGTLNGVFAGIMARLFTSPTHAAGPGGAENHVNYWKVQNGTTSIRRTQAGGNTTFVGAGPSGTDGWLLMQRVASTNFYFFEKTATNDLWTFVTNIVLVTASNNAPMEVGIAEQSNAGLNAVSTFDSFMLDAPGIVSATPPPPPASNVVMTLNANLSMTISYTVGTNADGTAIRSIVVMRDGAPVSAQPYTGMGLGGNPVFGDPNNSLGDGNYVVYRTLSGDTNVHQSVTVTGLTPGHIYYAAVYTFVGLGTTRTFNQDASTANALLQDGTLLFLEVLPTPPLPRGGIGFMQVLGHYTGGAVLNVSPFAAITSANTNIIKPLNGVLTGLSNGTVNITLVYSGVTNVAAVTVRDPGFTDGFTVSHDYLVSGVTGTGWQQMYNATEFTNPVPGSPYVAPAGSGPTVADANITSNSVLTITAAGDGWEGGLAGGLFIFRYVPGDFQMAIHILTNDYLNTLGPAAQFQYNQPGLLARAYGVDTNGNIGTPFGMVVPNANGTNDLGEYWVSFCRFDEFTIGTYPRQTIDGGVSGLGVNGTTQSGQTGEQGDMNFWLLVVRTKGSEFDFYKRLNETDPWRQVTNKTHYSISQFAGQPMQVGIMDGPWTGGGGVTRTVHFEKFMLDATTGSPLQISASGGFATLSWPPIPGATLQSTTTLQPTNWQPVGGTPILGLTGYSLTVPLGPGTRYFRLVQ